MRAGLLHHRKRWLALLSLMCAGAVVAVVLLHPYGADAKPNPSLHIGARPSPTARDADLLSWAEDLLTGRCLVTKGFSFTVDWNVDDSTPDFATMPYGTDDADLAGTYGYGIGPVRRAGTSGVKSDPNRDYLASLSIRDQQRFTIAMFGDDSHKIVAHTDHGTVTTNGNGCLSAARTQLYGDLDRWFALDTWVNSLDGQIVPRVLASPQYLAALATWRTCMAAAGHPADDPQASRAAVDKLYDSLSYDQAWHLERTVAAVDATCNRSSKLLMTAETVHAQFVDQLEKSRAADVHDYLARKAKAVDLARQLLAAPTR